jgi:hypothetical protein
VADGRFTSDKKPYYDALEVADAAWKSTGQVDVSALKRC